MPMTPRENWLRAARFQQPETLPVGVHISPASWIHLREDAEQICLRHPALFPNFEAGSIDFDDPPRQDFQRAGHRFTDAWGCVWETETDGLTGSVVEFPLADWGAFDGYQMPDPLTTNDHLPAPDYDALPRQFAEARDAGHVAGCGLPHGFFFLRLWYLRGFENLMLDLALGDERFDRLCEMVHRYCKARVQRLLACGPDMIGFPEDLGTQSASFVSPEMFRQRLAPVYRDLMQPCRDAGAVVHMHSDGNILAIVDQLIDAGVQVINAQDLCNGIEELKAAVDGRAAIDLDVDRQKTVPFGSPQEIRELVEMEVRTLGSREGGLFLKCGIYPPTPPENLEAVCSAFEEFRTAWS